MQRSDGVLAVLSALDGVRWRYTAEVALASGLSPQWTVKLLRTLVSEGLAVSELESSEAVHRFSRQPAWESRRFDQRAARRYFRLSPAGVKLRDEWSAQDCD